MQKLFLVTLIYSIIFIGCKKDDGPDQPLAPAYSIETGAVTNITNTQAWVSGSLTNVKNTEIEKFGHVWSTSENPTIDLSDKTEFLNTHSDTSFSSQLKNLVKSSTYYVRTYTVDQNGTFYGQEISFKTGNEFFKFIVSSNYLKQTYSYGERAWILIYTPDGLALDSAEIFNGNTYAFDWPEKSTSDQFMIQLFKSRVSTPPYNELEDYNMSCYLDVVPNTWLLGSEPQAEPNKIGRNKVIPVDINLNNYFPIVLQNSYGWGDLSSGSFESVYFDQYVDPDQIWIMYVDWDEKPFYAWYDEVNLNETLYISKSNVTEMTDYVDVSFPQGNSNLVYVESEDNLDTEHWDYYEVYWNTVNDQTTSRVYYPGDLFKGYYSYLIAGTGTVREYMIKLRGAIPEQFVSLPADIQLNNESILNFNASISDETDAVNLSWVNDESEDPVTTKFTYNVYGSKEDASSFSAPELPAMIQAHNESLLDLSKLQYVQTRFYEYDNLDGFEDYISYRYVQPVSVSGNFLTYYMKYISVNAKEMSNDYIDDKEVIRRSKQNLFFN